MLLFFLVFCYVNILQRIYLFSISPSANLQQAAAINRQNNDVLSKVNEKSVFADANKIKMNETQSDGTSYDEKRIIYMSIRIFV